MDMKMKAHEKSKDAVDIIINHRKTIGVIFGILVVLSIICSPFVKVNYDLTEYLPSSVQSKQGIEIMENEFGYPGSARVMIDDVTLYEAKQYKDKIAAVEGVDIVTWADTTTDIYQSREFIDNKNLEDYYKDGHSVMNIIFHEGDSSSVTSEAIDKIKEIVGDKGHYMGSAIQNKSLNENLSKEVKSVAVIAVIVILVILILTTTSWLEPILFLLVMGIAIIVNMGTNIFMGEISFLTQSVSAILQLAVAMDYSIFLMHSFTNARAQGEEPSKAITTALRHSAKSVIFCGLATTIGFVALTLMKFSIGFDMGVCLAKGIVISVLTVLLLMPAFILKFSNVIEKTAHRPFMPPFNKFAKGAYKIRYGVLVLAIILAIPSFIAKDMNSFTFGNSSVGSSEGTIVYQDEQAIKDQFGRSNLLMVLIPNTSFIKEKQLSQEIEALSYTTSVTSLANTVPEGIPISILPKSVTSMLHTDNYARMLIYINTKDESDLAFKCSDEIQSIVKKYYPENSYLIGATPCTQEIKSTIITDYNFVDKLSLLGVALVVMIAFRSLLLALLVLLPIESAIFINMAFPYLVGDTMVYMGYIIVSCVQLAATVDYAILMANNYLNSRSNLDKKEATIEAIAETTPPVLTSGMILSCGGFILYRTSSITAIAGMGQLISRGALLGIAVVVLMLPALLTLFDKPIIKHINKANKRSERRLQRLNERRERIRNRIKQDETIAD
ncbi:efflux RND transporter permease subunit [Ruminiclostridium herbifermentans]|nr:efflux RND transporter permease subunit [Ruminiclostridium herbifermentans]